MQTVYNELPAPDLHDVINLFSSATSIGEFTTEKYHVKVRQANKLDGEYRTLQVLSEFQGKTIPKLYSYLKAEKFDCLVTQLITGASISESLHSNLPKLFLQYAKILSEIHTKTGVIHCDIKPDHLIITANGPVILDFDLAYLPNQIKSTGWHHYLQYPNEYHLGEYRGSPKYSSINSHLGLAPSPSWDFESLYYSFLSLYQTLPWSGSDPQIRFINKLSYALSERHHLYNLVVESQRKDSFYFLEQFNKLVSEFVTTHNKTSINQDFQEYKIESRPEQSIKTNASLQEQTSSIEKEVRIAIEQILGARVLEHNLAITSSTIKSQKYYSKFRVGNDGQIDLYGTDIPTTNLLTLFSNEYHKMNIQLSTKISDKGTFLGEMLCFLKEENAEFSKLFLKKCAQLETDLIRFQCQTNSTPHPLEILDCNVWACVAVGAYQPIFNWSKGLAQLVREERGFPRIFLLALVGRFNLFIVRDSIIQNAIDERGWNSSISDKKEYIPTLSLYLLFKSGLSPYTYPIHDPNFTVKDAISEILQKNKDSYPQEISILVANSDLLLPDPAKATPIDFLWLEQNISRFAEGQVLIITLANYRQDVTLTWQKGSSGFEMKTKAFDF